MFFRFLFQIPRSGIAESYGFPVILVVGNNATELSTWMTVLSVWPYLYHCVWPIWCFSCSWLLDFLEIFSLTLHLTLQKEPQISWCGLSGSLGLIDLIFFLISKIYLFIYLFILNIYLFIYLVAPDLSCGSGLLSCDMRILSCVMHVGSSSLTRDRTRAPCIGSV